MSTPEHTPATGTTDHIGHTTTDDDEVTAALVARAAADAEIYSNATNPTRTTTVVSWIGWHIPEIGGITVPALLGSVAWDGFYAASALVAAGWVANELRTRRHNAKRRAARNTAVPQDNPDTDLSDEDGEPA